MRFVISLTSVPRRFDTSLRHTIQSILKQKNCPEIIINIPHEYRKWGACDLPSYAHENSRIIFHRPNVDYGPATKLLGGLIYLRDNPSVTHIVTIDDDFCFTNRNYIDFLMRCATIAPEAALTVGGIALENPPYRCDAGLRYRNRYRLIDIPAGYQGAVYPVAPLLASPLTFSLRDRLPDGIFNDDDAYFGILLSQLGVPLIALPRPLFSRLRSSIGAGESAVAEGVALDRKTNESEIYLDATRRGLLVPASRRSDGTFGIGRKIRMCYEHIKTALPA